MSQAIEAHHTAIVEGALVDWTVGDLLRDVVARVPDRIGLKEPLDAVSGRQRTWTYRALLEESERAARALLAHFQPGERVAIWAGNRPEWAILQFGAAFAGITLVALNPANKTQELLYALGQSRSVGVIYGRRYRDVDAEGIVRSVRDDLPALRTAIAIDDWAAFLDGGAPDMPLPAVDPASAAMIQYTSGTTGKPKGAVLAHQALVNTAQFSALRFELPLGSVWLTATPMFHTSGCVYSTMGALWNAGTHVLAPGFDPPQVLDIIEHDRVNWGSFVPTMAIALLDHPTFPGRDMSSMRVIVSGGSAVAPELVRRIERDFGVNFVMVFGQTETSCAVCQSHREDSDHNRMKTVGRVLPHIEARIADPRTRKTVAMGEVGEICVRGFSVLLEYFDLPEATAQAIDPEGWLHTGDLGAMEPDGYLTITGRLKDLINRGGEKIYPREVEDLLATHPGVANCAVFGVPDEKWGEQAAAALVLRPGAMETEESVKAWLRDRISRHKVPFRITFPATLPITTSGKIQKFMLRDAFVAGEL